MMSQVRSKKLKARGQNKPAVSPYGDAVIPRIWLSAQQKIHAHKAIADRTPITQSAAGPVFGTLIFTLSDVANANDFIVLYDMYRIDYVAVTFRPQFNMQALTTNAISTPLLYTVLDYDDGAALGAVASAREYQTCRETRFDKDCVRTLKPRFVTGVYNGSTFNSTAPLTGWVNISASTAEHYGVKYAITQAAIGQTALQSWNIEIEYHLSMKFTK